MPAGNGISYRAGGRRVAEAAELDLPPCSLCGAWRGDPCRTPNDNTTNPHAGRRSAKEDAIEALEYDEDLAMAEASDAGEPENWEQYL